MLAMIRFDRKCGVPRQMRGYSNYHDVSENVYVFPSVQDSCLRQINQIFQVWENLVVILLIGLDVTVCHVPRQMGGYVS